jgi:crossover junction endodeoxyribonuclease RuvC
LEEAGAMIVLGIDPGFAALGLAAVDVTIGEERIVTLAVVRTEKSARKLDVRASDDNMRRACELSVAISDFVARHRPVAIATEGQSWSRDAGVSAKIGMAWGVVAAIASRNGLAVVQASPQRIKNVICRSKTASKDDVILAIEERFPDIEWPKPKGVVEHAADAIGAVLACLDSPVLQMARKLDGRRKEPTSAWEAGWEETPIPDRVLS